VLCVEFAALTADAASVEVIVLDDDDEEEVDSRSILPAADAVLVCDSNDGCSDDSVTTGQTDAARFQATRVS
jgi:hypothetical protein